MPLSVVSVIEKNKLGAGSVFIACLEIDVIDPNTLAVTNTFYIANNTEAITYKGNTYTPVPFSMEIKTEAGSVPTINLSITDFGGGGIKLLNDYGGGVGFNVRVFVVNSEALDVAEPEVMEHFEVVGTSISEYVINFTLGAENALGRLFPGRRQMRDFCQWRKFKDPTTCGYAGPALVCDRTMNGTLGCKAKQNQARFGAFPGIIGSPIYFR